MRVLLLILMTTFLTFSVGAEEEDPESEKNQFFRISKKMSEHYARVQVLTIEVRNLIAKKRQTINRDELEVILKAIRKNYDELKSEVVLYNAAMDELKYRFPHKGEEATKQYKAIRLDSIEVEAKESGIELQLSELRDSVTKAYEPLPPEINPLNRPKPKPLFPTTTLPKRDVYEF